MTNKVLLLDGDILIYRACCKNTVKTLFSDTGSILKDIDDLFEDFLSDVEDIVRKYQFNDYILCLSSRNNFRKDLYKSYKANRKKIDKPQLFYAMLNRCLQLPGAEYYDGMEADDVMSIIQTTNSNTCIYSQDKDLMQVEGYHAVIGDRIVNGELRRDGTIVKIDRETGIRFLAQQMLLGDSCDNVKGLDGFGVKRSEQFIKSLGADMTEKDIFRCILDQYYLQFGDNEVAAEELFVKNYNCLKLQNADTVTNLLEPTIATLECII